MWTNRKTRGITVLFVFATLGAGCGGAQIVAETTNQVEQTESTASVTSPDQADSNIGADSSTTISSSTPSIPSTVISITTTSTVLTQPQLQILLLQQQQVKD